MRVPCVGTASGSRSRYGSWSRYRYLSGSRCGSESDLVVRVFLNSLSSCRLHVLSFVLCLSLSWIWVFGIAFNALLFAALLLAFWISFSLCFAFCCLLFALCFALLLSQFVCLLFAGSFAPLVWIWILCHVFRWLLIALVVFALFF